MSLAHAPVLEVAATAHRDLARTPMGAARLDEGAGYLDVLDDPAEWGAFSQACEGALSLWESNLVIEGMHCAACSISIEDALLKVPGVVSARVGAASHRATLVWNASQTRPSDWIRAVQRAGYTALPANDVFSVQRRRVETRKALWRWLVAGLCMMQVMMYAYPAYIAQPGDLSQEMEQLLRWASWVLTLPVILFSSGPFFKAALKDLSLRRIGMDLPVALGIAITFCVSTAGTFEPGGVFGKEVYFDSLTMFVFFLLTGRWLELRLRDRTAGALDALMNRMPDSVERMLPDGGFETIATRRVVLGDTVRILPGGAFPADGVIVSGHTSVDEALLTGESRPLPRGVGDFVLCGSHNLGGAVAVRIEKTGESTKFAQIVALMESAASSKPQIAQFADRLAKPFLLFVLLTSLCAGVWWWRIDPSHALMVAVAILVVTCPCALSLATPAAMLASAGALAKAGVLVRRLQALEVLAHVDHVVFDKTGTMTTESMALHSVVVRPGGDVGQVFGMAAALAQESLHPASRAVVAEHQRRIATGQSRLWLCRDAREHVGQGVSGTLSLSEHGANSQELRLGSAAFCGVPPLESPHLCVFLSDAQGCLATFEFEEEVRPRASEVVARLERAGIAVQMMSGDSERATSELANRVGIRVARGAC
ncbi:MAG: heavy metal translocating P-type ATPase, partial [Burkholderiales bacterium PBB4]